VEICFPATQDDVAGTLRSRGYVPDEKMRAEFEVNIWHLADPPKSWDTEDEMAAYIAEGLNVIGGLDDMTFHRLPLTGSRGRRRGSTKKLRPTCWRSEASTEVEQVAK
jgi:hypothetical protein